MTKEIDIETLEVAGLASALKAVRLPHNGKEKSEIQSYISGHPYSDMTYQETQQVYHLCTHTDISINEKDMSLLQKLIKTGDQHGKVSRGILAWFQLSAPRMFWQEFDTYRIGVEKLSSTSTMHTITKDVLTIDNFAVNDIIKQALTPNPHERTENPLHFDTPEELRCVVMNKHGRDYEVWNNGDIYALPFTTQDLMPNGETRVRNHPKKKLNYGKKSISGYYQVGLGGRKGRGYLVHRLIAEAFVDNPNNYNIVNHKDGNKGNCSPSNLEWCTSLENNKHAYDTGLKTVGIRQKYLAYKNASKYDEDDICAWRILQADGWSYDKIHKHTGASVSVLQKYLGNNTFEYECEYNQDFKKALDLEKIIEHINELGMLYEETKDNSILYDIKSLLPDSFIQTRIVMASYQSLRRIYFQRHNHRLPQWRQLCEWIDTLPLSQELITIGLEGKDNGDPDLK